MRILKFGRVCFTQLRSVLAEDQSNDGKSIELHGKYYAAQCPERPTCGR